MARKGNTARKQEKFLQCLLLGKSIVDAAKDAGIAERTAHRWLGDPDFQEQHRTRAEALVKAEQAEIERIMTTGYAAVHERVKALDKMARELEKPYTSQDTGRTYELRNSPEHVREWRGCLDDISKETGGRIKFSKQELTGKDGAPVSSFHTVFVLPQLDEEEQDADANANGSPPAIE